MAKAPERSPLTGNKVPPYYLHSSSAFFRDTHGRAVLLRGVNFSGTSKAPIGQPTQRSEGFWEDAEDGGQSFVGQPLNLQDGSADVHLRRLRLWGFNCFRWVFTWEALEHQGPGKYDYEYMDYIVEVLRKCKEYGFRVYMDPHQDVFSRFTGGSGAPYWVLPACGIDHRGLTPTKAAYIHCEWPSPEAPDPESFPDMLWATNYVRLAPATLSALFFAGHDVAPRCKIDGVPISHWLQNHFFAAVRELALKIEAAGDLFDETVIGWDSLNEPNKTLIGLADVRQLPEEWKLRQGPMPTPLEGMKLGTGSSQTVQNWIFTSLGPKRKGQVTVDPQGSSIWLSAEEDAKRGGDKWGWRRDPDWPLGQCVWAAHGVWDQETGEVLKPHYFNELNPDGEVDFISQYWLPFWRKYSNTIRPIHKEAIMLIQPPVFEPAPHELSEEEDLKGRVAASPHFYDGLTLITKHWNWFNADAVGLLRGKYAGLPFALRFGEKAIRKCLRDQLGYLRQDTADVLGKYPTIIGELGIPFDLDTKRTYFGDKKGKGKGDYSSQTKALDGSLNACDGTNVLNYTLWTYCPDSTHIWGDGWNGEDLSIWSLDDVSGVDGATRTRDPNVVPDITCGDGLRQQLSVLSHPTPGLSSVPSTSSLTLQQADSATVSRPETANSDGSQTRLNIQGDSQINLLAKNDVLLTTFPLKDGQHLTTNAIKPALVNLFAGSRSAEAFSRPYPIATTGSPVSIDFDIKSSEFRYTLELDAEDLQRTEGRTTEIFVPLVHYAEDEVLAEAMGRSDISTEGKRLQSTCISSLRPDRTGQHTISRDETLATLNIDSNKEDKAQGAASQHVASCSHKDLVTNSLLPPLSLDVSVSAGAWEVNGQVLKWHLPADAASNEIYRSGDHLQSFPSQESCFPNINRNTIADKNGEGKVKHQITIKRRGGAIGHRAAEEARQQASWFDSCTIL
ncbi:unnamed protein product [Sympodiomycopsis kandeliae]